MPTPPKGQSQSAFARPRIFLSPPDRIAVRIPFDESTIQRLKSVPGYRWESEKNYWSFPRTRGALEQLLAALRIDWHQLDHEVAVGLGLIKSTSPQPQRVLPSPPPAPSDLEALGRELRIRDYSPKTIKAYESSVRSLIKHFSPQRPHELSDRQIREYVLFLLGTKKLAARSVNQVLNALRFLYVEVYRKPMVLGEIPRPKNPQKLPAVLSEEEVQQLLERTKNLKHKSLLMLTYSAGLRVEEAVQMKVANIDGERMMVHVQKAKGKKDRYVPLAEMTLSTLREYWKKEQPKEWLFPGKGTSGYLSKGSAQKVFYAAAARAGIKKRVSIHSLRHSFATHLLEAGVDIRYIQEILGHANLKTTEIYTHVSKKKIEKIVNPLDRIYLNSQGRSM
jgi:integrase/recombinase XerD